MPKNNMFAPQTIDADDEDTDICPVCDGQCTCQKLPPLPSLKIKLTVPQGLRAKHHLVSSNSAVQTTSDSVKHGYPPRKRGRPPKPIITPSRSRTYPAISPLDYKSWPSASLGPTKIKQKARAALVKRVAAVARRKKTNARKNLVYEDDDDDDDDRCSYPAHFPTFISASAVESLGSSSDSDSDSDNDSRDNLRGREREKNRTRRELLGDDPLRRKLGHPINNEWVIRSRKSSVDLTEAEGGACMDIDSESDDEDDEKSDGLQDEDPEDEDDGPDPQPTTTTTLLPFLESRDSETADNLSPTLPHQRQQHPRRHFVRLGKAGWSFSSSEDEESSFDAELFFRYLYDSSSSSSSSSGEEEDELTEGQDNDERPLTAPFSCPPNVESLPFELAESWDGGVVFTNGEGITTGDPALGFAEADKLGRGAFGFRGRGDSDVEMDLSMGIGGCATCLEEGYLEEDGECEGDEDGYSFNEANDDNVGLEGCFSEGEEGDEGGSGNTTDEDLVGSDSLPNERAMRLFKLPTPVWGSLSAVDPLSLVSSRPRRELEMMEVVEGAGEKRRRGKGKNKGKGRMRRETREKGGRERRKEQKEQKKRKEALPNPFDILEGKGAFWDLDDEMNISDEDGEETSCSLSSCGSLQRSPRTPTPTPARSPTTPVPTTPALSTITSFTTGPRKGVFVVPSVVSEWIESGKRRGKGREKALVVIKEDSRGEDVPSPHPRKRHGQSIGGGEDVVERILKRHLIETLGASSFANIGSDATTTVMASPPPTPHLAAPFSPMIDDGFSSSSIMRAIQLADVLDAEFLKDGDKDGSGDWDGSDGEDRHEKGQEMKGELDSSLDVLESEKRGCDGPADSATTTAVSTRSYQSEGVQASPLSTSALIPRNADLAADAAAVKNLSRWDVIPVGAFRQSQQQVRQEGAGESTHHHVGVGVGQGHSRTPGSSTDYGNAMKKSGKFALGVLWRGGGGTKAAVSTSPGTAPGPMRRTASGGMIGSKHAKKRRLMMNSSSTSVMKQPLVLPATSIGAASGSNVPSSSTTSTSAVNGTNSNANVHGKTRKEARRERKLQKRNASHPYSPHAHSFHPHSHHHHHHHMYHTHYHHPNAKSRGVASAQRLGGGFVGGGSGSGPGSGGGGSGTWSGISGSGGVGGLSF